MHIFADGFNQITLANNNLRITLTQNGPDNTVEKIATLILPVNQAAQFANGLTSGLKQLDEQIKKQQGQVGEQTEEQVQ